MGDPRRRYNTKLERRSASAMASEEGEECIELTGSGATLVKSSVKNIDDTVGGTWREQYYKWRNQSYKLPRHYKLVSSGPRHLY